MSNGVDFSSEHLAIVMLQRALRTVAGWSEGTSASLVIALMAAVYVASLQRPTEPTEGFPKYGSDADPSRRGAMAFA